jgi:hypothetical protein
MITVIQLQSYGRDAAPTCQMVPSHRLGVWNTDVPMLRLPDELLVNITHDLIYSDELRYPDILRAHYSPIWISRRLRSLFLQTPKLWNHVRSTWSLPWIDHCLRRAKIHQLCS